MKWINVKDKLPKRDSRVIVYCKNKVNPNKSITEMWFNTFGEFIFHSFHGYTDLTKNVTHWMPLPEPPK